MSMSSITLIILRVISAGVPGSFRPGVLAPQSRVHRGLSSATLIRLEGVGTRRGLSCAKLKRLSGRGTGWDLPAQGVPWEEEVAGFHMRAPPGVPCAKDLPLTGNNPRG